MFKPTAAKTPEEYIDLVAEPRKSEIKKLHEFILKNYSRIKTIYDCWNDRVWKVSL